MLAGGAGTRFWPASRAALPKPFVALLGEQSLLEVTLQRLAGLPGAMPARVVASTSLAHLTRRALRAHRGARLLEEPSARNTAAAIAWSAACVLGEGCDGVVGIFPADHHISKPEVFARTLKLAARTAKSGEKLVLLGVQPTRPDPAYGYLRIGKPARAAVRVQRFVEKPSPARAKRYLASGEYVWNAGMLIARPERILAETREHSPEVWGALGGLLEKLAAGGRVSRQALARAYAKVEPISFDYAVLERSRRAFALRARFPWSDLGSWDALGEHLPGVSGNATRGAEPVLLDATGNIVWNSTDKTLVLLGVCDLVVVETPDALLICPKDRAQDVRGVVKQLSRRGRKDLA